MWHVYLLLCADRTIYVGITTDIIRRVRQHNQGVGAKYTRGRRPVRLYTSFECVSRSQALKLEAQIKKLPRQVKLNTRTFMHIGPISDDQGSFGKDKLAPDVKCLKCQNKNVTFKLWESSCGGYEDVKYTCGDCKYYWWVDGIDS